MASISERKGSYRIRIFQYRDESGKEHFKTITYKPTSSTHAKQLKEVQKVAADLEKKVREGYSFEADRMTFVKFSEEWDKNWALTNLTEEERENYKRILKNRVYPSIGHMPLSSIKPMNVQTIITEESKVHAPKTVRRTFTAMNSVFKYAYNMSLIHENPCSRVTLPKLSHDDAIHYFTLDQSKRFLNFLDDTYFTEAKSHERTLSKTGNKYHVSSYFEEHAFPTQFKALFYLAIYGGFRRGELVALKWSDINFTDRTISIARAVAKAQNRLIIKEPKTHAGIRTLTMPQGCMKILSEWKREEVELRFKLGTAWRGEKDFSDTWIFIQNDGSMMYPDTPLRRFKQVINLYNSKIEEEASYMTSKREQKQKLSEKLPYIHFHDLRHTSATLLISEGTDIDTVSHRLGHSKPSVTLDVYSHFLEAKDTEASDTLERLFSS